MAILPKTNYNGTRVKTFKYNGVELFEAEYTQNSETVKCYHKHKGKAGQTEANGCYTVLESYGGNCKGHINSYIYEWSCGYCGTDVSGSSRPTSCPNRACWNNEHVTSNWYPHSNTHTTYCSDSSTCNNWGWEYRYALGCGYDEE